MPTTSRRRIPALLTALAAGSLLVLAVHPSRAADAPAPAKVRVQALGPAMPGTVVWKIGRALLEERDVQINLRTETYRDEITTASARTGAAIRNSAGPAKG